MGTGYDQGCADFRGVFARCMSLHLAEADIPAQSNGAGFDPGCVKTRVALR